VVADNESRWLFSSSDTSDPRVHDYVDEGEHRGVDKGYKASRRGTWHDVPLPKARPDFFLPAMSHRSPRLIHNPLAILGSNLLCFADRGAARAAGPWLAAASLSSVTALSAEVEGRTYGGGVLTVQPSEAERLLVPLASPTQRARLSAAVPRLDRLVRS